MFLAEREGMAGQKQPHAEHRNDAGRTPLVPGGDKLMASTGGKSSVALSSRTESKGAKPLPVEGP